MWFRLFVWLFAIIQAAGVAIIITLRCILDDELHTSCSESLDGKSLSWLLDWSWLQTFSAVLFGGAAFLNIWFAFGLLYPCYRDPYKHWYIWLLRMLHAGGFFGVAVVGVFDLNEHHDFHMLGAFWLFVVLSLECILVLFIPQNICNVQKLLRPSVYLTAAEDKIWDANNYRIWFSLQILHALFIPMFALFYFFFDWGPYEWIAIWLILFYYTWFARDHDDEIVHTDLVDHPSKECSYGEFQPMTINSLGMKCRE